MTFCIDINCDLGEGSAISGSDEAVMPFITSANIACGFHAGDPLTMEKTIRSAVMHGVAVGAHPGYPDRDGFGRKKMAMDRDELRAMILYQAAALKGMAEAAGTRMTHVKPHGALYNSAATDFEMSLIIARAVKELDSSLVLVGLSGSQIIRAARETGISSASEVFADRQYNDDGTLVSRDLPGAVINDTGLMIQRVIRMITEKTVVTVTGRIIAVEADTVCIHGDNKAAPEFVRRLASALRGEEIELRPPLNRK
jgi:UPF0271 protein